MRTDIVTRLEIAASAIPDPLLSEAAAEIRSLRRRLVLAQSGIDERGEFTRGLRLGLSVALAVDPEEGAEALLELVEDMGGAKC